MEEVVHGGFCNGHRGRGAFRQKKVYNYNGIVVSDSAVASDRLGHSVWIFSISIGWLSAFFRRELASFQLLDTQRCLVHPIPT
jgi:hypothetical protein